MIYSLWFGLTRTARGRLPEHPPTLLRQPSQRPSTLTSTRRSLISKDRHQVAIRQRPIKKRVEGNSISTNAQHNICTSRKNPSTQRQNACDWFQCRENEFKPRKPETPPKSKTLREEERGRETQTWTDHENQGTGRLANRIRSRSNEAHARRKHEKL